MGNGFNPLMNLPYYRHNRNMKALLVPTLTLLLANHAFPQQIASVDLTQRLESTQPTERQKVTPLAEACAEPTGGVFDGVVLPDDKRPREISVEFTNLSSVNPQVGSEVVADIRLRNIDKKPINIPWSTDPSVIEKGQSPDHLEWEQGGFEVRLKDHRNNGFVLKSLDMPLYGSKFSPGSQLTIQPGEWVSARMNFKIEDRYFGTPEGESRLSVEWEQASRTWTRSKCGVTTGWFGYNRGFYKQERPSVTIQVTGSGPAKTGRENK